MALHISIRKIGWLFIIDGNTQRIPFKLGVFGGDDFHGSVDGSISAINDDCDFRFRLGNIGISFVGLRCRGSRPLSFRHLLRRIRGGVCGYLGSLRHGNPDGKTNLRSRCDHRLISRRERARFDDQRTGERESTEHGPLERSIQGAYRTSFGGLIIFAGFSAVLSGIGFFGGPPSHLRPSTPLGGHALEQDPLIR